MTVPQRLPFCCMKPLLRSRFEGRTVAQCLSIFGERGRSPRSRKAQALRTSADGVHRRAQCAREGTAKRRPGARRDRRRSAEGDRCSGRAQRAGSRGSVRGPGADPVGKAAARGPGSGGRGEARRRPGEGDRGAPLRSRPHATRPAPAQAERSNAGQGREDTPRRLGRPGSAAARSNEGRCTKT